MSKSPSYRVLPRGDEWIVSRDGSARATSVHSTQSDAIESGRPVAMNQGTELVIHRPNGQIREAWSYGNDPYPPQG